ncbi:hypothetical protein PILCRDRAFT_133336 [Piloderma croceum F 1598]|uniref:Uncharacterized protein n=1 Tax=Piloderma croceum (strain F 1598) TaxID=765440 RepID=A0A0C3BYE4_PILCF|nr:hypothetical protein PILCRDRAFT_133336 [Piloderma croceum F 1598]
MTSYCSASLKGEILRSHDVNQASQIRCGLLGWSLYIAWLGRTSQPRLVLLRGCPQTCFKPSIHAASALCICFLGRNLTCGLHVVNALSVPSHSCSLTCTEDPIADIANHSSLMDPASLGIVLNGIVTITRIIQQKIDKLNRIFHQEMASAEQYGKTLVVFSNDLDEVTTKLNTITHHGNKAAATALLNTTDGRKSFDLLLNALKSADDLLKRQERAADAFIVGMQKKSSPPVNLVSLLSDADMEHQRFDATLGVAIATLDALRTDVIRRFEQFHALYTIHREGGGSQAVPLSRTCGQKNLIDSLQLSFYNRPFDIDIDESCAFEIAEGVGITSDKNRQDPYTLVMKEKAERWVDNQLGEVTVGNLGRTQINMMLNLQKVLNAELNQADRDASSAESMRYAHLSCINTDIEKAIIRDNNKWFSIAFFGMVKAGYVQVCSNCGYDDVFIMIIVSKSLFLNALMGHMILPSDELPATAWPCRVRHVKDQLTPKLEIDAVYFQRAIDSLRTHKFSAMIAGYQPSKEPDLISTLQDELSSTATVQNNYDRDRGAVAEYTKKREIYNNLIDLQPTTKSNLRKFERIGYRIPDSASGDEHVCDLLAEVNDVVRLCRRMKVELPNIKDTTWPLMTIEFEALRDEKFEGNFEFVDLPVSFTVSEEYYFSEVIFR